MTKAAANIAFHATLHRPAKKGGEEIWAFLRLPQSASDKLSSRSMVSVEGTIDNHPFVATLQPDGQGGHWLKVSEKLAKEAAIAIGDNVAFNIAPTSVEPEPEVPDDLQAALEAHPKAHEVWNDITAIARRDWISWMTSGKKAETRPHRINVAMDKLSKGMRRACCFDRSGMYSNSMSCPVAADE